MTVNASNELGYRTASVNFTVHRPTEARVSYAQVPPTAVVGQTFVVSVDVEANTYSLLDCSLYLNDTLIGNVSDSDVVVRRPGHYVVLVTAHVCVDIGRHRLTLVAADIAFGKTRKFIWFIDSFYAITDVVIDLPAPAIATGSTTSFTVRHLGGSDTVTYLWEFGDQSSTVDTGATASSPAHTYTHPGTYVIRATATNNVSRVTGTATLNVVDVIAGVMLAYDGPTSLGDHTFVKAVAGRGTQVTYNFSTSNATKLATSKDAVMVKYSTPGRHEVTVLAHNAVSNSSASLVIYVVDRSTLFVLGVGNATCGLPLRSVVVFHADVVCANTSIVIFYWSVPGVLNSSGRGLNLASANFTAPGVYELTLTAWNNAIRVRKEYKLCVNESVPEESTDLQDFHIGISRIEAPYLPAEHDVIFFPIISRCPFTCNFYWKLWDSIPPTKMQGFKVQYAFQKAGVFNVSLTVTKRQFTQKTTSTTVVVNRRIEQVLLQARVEVSNVNEPIEFVVRTTPDDRKVGNLTYYWSFYDIFNTKYVGNSSQMTYAFQGEGIRRVTVTVHNNVSAMSANTSVNVCGKISGLTFTGCCGRAFNTSVHFEAFVQTGQISSYHWTLRNDDGVALAASAEQVFVYKFESPGHYQIQLTAENPLSNQTVIDYFKVQVSCIASVRTLVNCKNMP